MTVSLASDTFTRGNQSAWGTASDGTDVWSVVIGGAANFSIASNEGKITGVTSLQVAYLGSNTFADMEVLVRFAPSAVADVVYAFLRGTASNTQYRIKQVNTTFSIIRTVTGTATTLASGSFTTIAGAFHWIRARVVGTNLYAKIWAASGGEPANWTLTTTDSNITGAGQWGLGAQLSATGDTMQFDSLTVNQGYNLTEQTQAKFYTRTPLTEQTQAKFYTRTPLKAQTQAKFYTRMGLKSSARSRFYTRLVGLSAASRAKFYTRMGLQGQGRDRFSIRTPLSSAARATFKSRASLVLRAVSKFIITISIKTPLKATFGTVTQHINATFAEAILARPFSTINVPATLTDASGTLITTASASVLITFPDQSTQTIAATNQGAGVYQIQYNTKAQGLIRETWSFTGADGSLAQYTNITPVSS